MDRLSIEGGAFESPDRSLSFVTASAWVAFAGVMTNSSDSQQPDFPVMDGALDDMSDGGTSKGEANDLVEEGRKDEVEMDPGVTGAEELGGADTVAANDELSNEEVER